MVFFLGWPARKKGWFWSCFHVEACGYQCSQHVSANLFDASLLNFSWHYSACVCRKELVYTVAREFLNRPGAPEMFLRLQPSDGGTAANTKQSRFHSNYLQSFFFQWRPCPAQVGRWCRAKSIWFWSSRLFFEGCWFVLPSAFPTEKAWLLGVLMGGLLGWLRICGWRWVWWFQYVLTRLFQVWLVFLWRLSPNSVRYFDVLRCIPY